MRKRKISQILNIGVLLFVNLVAGSERKMQIGVMKSDTRSRNVHSLEIL